MRYMIILVAMACLFTTSCRQLGEQLLGVEKETIYVYPEAQKMECKVLGDRFSFSVSELRGVTDPEIMRISGLRTDSGSTVALPYTTPQGLSITWSRTGQIVTVYNMATGMPSMDKIEIIYIEQSQAGQFDGE